MLHHSLDMHRTATADTHHFALHNSGIVRMTSDVVKVCARISQQFFSWRQVAGEWDIDRLHEAAKNKVKHCTV